MADADCCSTQVVKAIEKTILPYIDSLQEEPASEELEKFVRDYREKYWYPDDIDKFIGFARRVARWQREQMMKDAVDAFIYKGGIRLKEWPLPEKYGKHLAPIKLIIIKEE